MSEPAPPLALTMGEPGGIAPEITIAAWRALRQTDSRFFLIADPSFFTDIETARIATPDEAAAVFASALPIMPLENPVAAAPGFAKAETAPAVIESIERAVSLALAGAAGAVVTNPIQKSALLAGGFAFPGHTEFLDALAADMPMPAGAPRGAVMMLAGPALRTVPVTVHQSVRDAIDALRPDRIVECALVTAHALNRDFGVVAPRLAISGLNPHAGEAGAMGAEDELIIAPAVDELRARGIDAVGPLPADTMFHEEARSRYDAALCMLHDQALIPAKTLAFDETVNVTLGLPFVRTSPDHGTALDIAGKGVARATSLIAALRMAADIAARRRGRN